MPSGNADPGERPAFAFLTRGEARALEALAERIFPTDELGPGAFPAGVVTYIDRALSGAETGRQGLYRTALALLDRAAEARHGSAFSTCKPVEQDSFIREMIDGTIAWSPAPPTSAAFFDILRAHVLEGMFSDPAHGGNRDFIGWKLLGYWGPVPSYSHEEQQLDAKITRPRFYSAADYPLAREEKP